MIYGDYSMELQNNYETNKTIFLHVQEFLCQTKSLHAFFSMQLR